MTARRIRALLGIALVLVAATGCPRRTSPRAPIDASAPASEAGSVSRSDASDGEAGRSSADNEVARGAAADDAGSSAHEDAALDAGREPGRAIDGGALALPDGGVGACRMVGSPVELSPRGAVALAIRERTVDAVVDADGRPRTYSFAVARPGTRPSFDPVATPGSADGAKGLSVPCAVAGDHAYCPDRAGAVHRSMLDGSDDRVVASSRSGTRVAATALAGTHAALGYLASRQTTEGWVSEAWLAVDDAPPVRVSEAGSGATAITLAPRGPDVVAMIVDARTALTAMHVRRIAYDGALRLGEDVVVFVGGPGDRRTAGALALSPGAAGLALMPIAKDVGDFGLAIVRLDDPPHVDEPVAWAMYPNGLDPAPVAAAVAAGRTWVARVRPEEAAPGSRRVLEIGEIRGADAWTPLALVPTTGVPLDVSAGVDGAGTLWIGWLDAAGSWVARVACR